MGLGSEPGALAGQRDLGGAPVAGIARAGNQPPALDPVHEARETGLLQVQQPSQLRHPDRTADERAEELCLLGREVAAPADLGEHMRHQVRQAHQRLGEPCLPGRRGHRTSCLPV